MEDTIYLERPWRRLLWELPAALVITGLALAAFTKFLEAPAHPPAQQKPVTTRIIELPPVPNPMARPSPPPPALAPHVAHRPPPVRRPPPPKEETPPEQPEVEQPAPEKPVERPRIRRPMPERPMPRLRRPPPLLEEEAPPEEAAPVRPRLRPRAVTPPAPAEETAPEIPAPPPVTTRGSSLPGGGTMGARAIYQPKPEIPSDLLGQDINTSVTALFHIAADGTTQVELVQPTDDPRLNRVILETLQRWRFFPAIRDGHPMESTMRLNLPIQVQ